MLKKFSGLILVMLLICYVNVYAKAQDISEIKKALTELNIIDEETFSTQNIVSRGECITAIMHVIGVNDENITLLSGADFYAFADTESYSYFGCAYRANIAYGEERLVDYPTYRTSHTGKDTDIFFFSARPATIKEAVAFMVRCLEDSKENKNIDIAFEKAKAYGLVYDNELSGQCMDPEISQDYFIILLERFLQQKRYKFYQKKDNYFSMKGYIDEERSLTYADMLKQCQRQGDSSIVFEST